MTAARIIIDTLLVAGLVWVGWFIANVLQQTEDE
jgi:hypothetical protein